MVKRLISFISDNCGVKGVESARIGRWSSCVCAVWPLTCCPGQCSLLSVTKQACECQEDPPLPLSLDLCPALARLCIVTRWGQRHHLSCVTSALAHNLLTGIQGPQTASGSRAPFLSPHLRLCGCTCPLCLHLSPGTPGGGAITRCFSCFESPWLRCLVCLNSGCRLASSQPPSLH